MRHSLNLLRRIRPHVSMLGIEARHCVLPAARLAIGLLRYPVIHRSIHPLSRLVRCLVLFRLAFGAMTAPATFVHDPGDHQFTATGRVVALTAMAYEACTRAGLSPTVLDDHTRRPDVCTDPSEYQRWQLDWLERLDTAFHFNGVARSCAQLIVPAVDAIVITARMLTGAVETLAPDAITYVGRVGPVEASGYHNGHLQFWPRLGDVPLAARLLA